MKGSLEDGGVQGGLGVIDVTRPHGDACGLEGTHVPSQGHICVHTLYTLMRCGGWEITSSSDGRAYEVTTAFKC